MLSKCRHDGVRRKRVQSAMHAGRYCRRVEMMLDMEKVRRGWAVGTKTDGLRCLRLPRNLDDVILLLLELRKRVTQIALSPAMNENAILPKGIVL